MAGRHIHSDGVKPQRGVTPRRKQKSTWNPWNGFHYIIDAIRGIPRNTLTRAALHTIAIDMPP